MVQMSHVEVSKEEKLADTMRGWYANAKARQAEYAQQLAQLDASPGATAKSSIAFNNLTGDEPWPRAGSRLYATQILANETPQQCCLVKIPQCGCQVMLVSATTVVAAADRESHMVGNATCCVRP